MVSPKNIVISAQAFPPRTGGKQSLMEGLAAHASAAGAQVNVYTDLKKGEDAYDSAQNKPYQIKRFGGIKPLRQRRVARAVARYAAQNETASIFCDSWHGHPPYKGERYVVQTTFLSDGAALARKESRGGLQMKLKALFERRRSISKTTQIDKSK